MMHSKYFSKKNLSFAISDIIKSITYMLSMIEVYYYKEFRP